MITILASLGQEEPRSISKNTKWGILRGFDNANVFLNPNRFLEYDKPKNGNLIINEAGAEIVKRRRVDL